MMGAAMKTRFKLSAFFCLGLYSCICTSMAIAQADYSMVNARDTVHINNCGSCHLPYAPGLLPVKSWIDIMTGLESHFGSKVEVSEENSTHILAYLEKYALATGQQSVMGQLAKDLPDTPPLRITELPAFIVLHSNTAELLELKAMDRDSLSACASCHRAAASHIFDKALLQVGVGDGPLSDYK